MYARKWIALAVVLAGCAGLFQPAPKGKVYAAAMLTPQDIYSGLASDANFTSALQVSVPLGQPAGTYTQNVTFTSIC